MMLDPKFKNMCFISNYVGQKRPTILVVEYDEQLLLLLFAKCYKLLMPIVIEEHKMEGIIIDYDDIFHNIPTI
jgi:hypothetical protein